MSIRPVRRVREVLVHENPWVRVYDDDVLLPDGRPGHHVRIDSPGGWPGVVLLALCDGDAALVHTYRYALGRPQWALPRGFAHGADPLATARAELREELGADRADLRLLGWFTPDSGLLATRVAVVRALLPERADHPEDTDEVAAVRWVPAASLWSLAAAGDLDDGMTFAAMTLALSTGDFPGPAAV
jgi:8-oxo-dGTP pyrophosphatase MutT (NUDIX family)